MAITIIDPSNGQQPASVPASSCGSHLLQLPLECIRQILDSALYEDPLNLDRFNINFPDVEVMLYLRALLRLRLVNRFFDWEILLSMERQRILYVARREPCICVPASHCQKANRADMSLFVAKYALVTRSHEVKMFDGDLASFIYHVVNELEPKDGFAAGEQLQLAVIVCREVLESTNQEGFKLLLSFYPSGITRTTLDQHVQVARIFASGNGGSMDNGNLELSGRPYSDLLGSALYAAIKTRQYALVRCMLDGDADVNDPKHRALETASLNSDKEMIELLLAPQFHCSFSSRDFEAAINSALRFDKTEIATLLLDHAVGQQLTTVIHDGTRYACFHNNVAMMQKITEVLGGMEPNARCHYGRGRAQRIETPYETLMEIAAFMGHVSLLRAFFQSHGEPSPEDKKQLIYHGALGRRADVVLFLWSPEVDFSGGEWQRVFEIQMENDEFHSPFWEELVRHDIANFGQIRGRDGILTYPLMFKACREGYVEVVKFLAAQGVPIGGSSYDMPPDTASPPPPVPIHLRKPHNTLPLLTAMKFSQHAVVNLLLELGAAPCDPMSSHYAKALNSDYPPQPKREIKSRLLKRPIWQRFYTNPCYLSDVGGP